MTWIILTHHHPSSTLQPMDGEFYHDKNALLRALNYAEKTDRVAEFDLGEFIRDGATSFRDVTEEMVWEGLQSHVINLDAEIAEPYVRSAA